MPVRKSRKSSKSGKKKASSSFLYNPVDPLNQYPNYKTGEEEYGPIPPFGYNEHDPMNMQPFNPNMMSAVMGGPMHYPSPAVNAISTLAMPPPYNMLAAPMAPIVPLLGAPGMVAPGVASLPPIHAPGAFSAFGNPGYGYGMATPQVANNMDPNNQFPNPLTGDYNNPGPAQAGGANVFDPHNLIGAPYMDDSMHNRMANLPQHPQSPYIMTPRKRTQR